MSGFSVMTFGLSRLLHLKPLTLKWLLGPLSTPIKYEISIIVAFFLLLTVSNSFFWVLLSLLGIISIAQQLLFSTGREGEGGVMGMQVYILLLLPLIALQLSLGPGHFQEIFAFSLVKHSLHPSSHTKHILFHASIRAFVFQLFCTDLVSGGEGRDFNIIRKTWPAQHSLHFSLLCLLRKTKRRLMGSLCCLHDCLWPLPKFYWHVLILFDISLCWGFAIQAL